MTTTIDKSKELVVKTFYVKSLHMTQFDELTNATLITKRDHSAELRFSFIDSHWYVVANELLVTSIGSLISHLRNLAYRISGFPRGFGFLQRNAQIEN